jgi:hypothetical protein
MPKVKSAPREKNAGRGGKGYVPRKSKATCKCGSTEHARTSHHDCPLRTKNPLDDFSKKSVVLTGLNNFIQDIEERPAILRTMREIAAIMTDLAIVSSQFATYHAVKECSCSAVLYFVVCCATIADLSIPLTYSAPGSPHKQQGPTLLLRCTFIVSVRQRTRAIPLGAPSGFSSRVRDAPQHRSTSNSHAFLHRAGKVNGD